MKNNDNKKRPFYILKLLRKYSDEEHFITTESLLQYLKEEYNLDDFNRKTIYNDVDVLDEVGYGIDKKRGFNITESPFTLAEIKILSDLILNFKNLGQEGSTKLINKLYDYVSIYQRDLLKSLEFNVVTKKQSKLLNYVGLVLLAISSKSYLLMPDKSGKMTKIIPFLLDYKNNFYYLYYGYEGSSKNYHKRFDRIKDLDISDEKYEDIYQNRVDQCLKMIKESVSSYHSDQSEYIKLYYDENKKFIKGALEDDFENIMFNTVDGKACANFSANISNDFFGMIAKYGNNVKIISPENVINKYQAYLKHIIDEYNK